MRDDPSSGDIPSPVDDEETDRIAAKFANRLLGAPEPPAPGGLTIGRYVGAVAYRHGGMGRIFVAYDPGLDRHVAIKALPVGLAPSEPDAALPEREGKALARIDHPNVVRVFDLVEHRGLTCLVLERIDGLNLAQWLRARERGWREVLPMFLAAGEGLAAVHRAGLVHRDVKPANVVVGPGGVVKLIDFGLAVRAAPGRGAHEAGAGTPRYMAPEQIAGRELDARADQFAFCIALYEALFGAHPFLARDIAASVDGDASDVLDAEAEQATRRTILEQIGGGLPRRPERAPPGLPPHVLPALLRGLSRAPDARFPTMHALLAELRRDPRRTRRRALSGLLAALALGLGAYLGLRPETCPSLADEEARLWGDLRDDIEPRLRPLGPGATNTLDAAVRDQARQQRDACKARIGGDRQDTDLARDACLRTHEVELVTILRRLAVGDDDERARLVRGLAERPAGTCADPSRLRYSCTEDGASAFARTKAVVALLAGDYAGADTSAGEAMQAADARGAIGSRALAHLLRGRIAHERGDFARARAELGAAQELAESNTCLAIAADVYPRLVKLAAFDPAIPTARGEDYSRLHEFRISEGDIAAQADMLGDRGLFAERRLHDLARAESLQRQAIALRQAAHDLTIGQADSYLNLASVLYARGRAVEAREALREADVRRAAVLGPGHPDHAKHLLTRAALEIDDDNPAFALALLEQALRYAQALGADAPALADIHTNRVLALDRLNDRDGALAAAKDVLRVYAGLAPDDPRRGEGLENFGQILISHGRFTEALATFRESEGLQDLVGAGAVDRGVLDFRVADALAGLERFSESEARARRALVRFDEAGLPPDHDVRAHASLLLGEALLGQSRWREAVGPLERAVTTWRSSGANPQRLGWAQWGLGKAACRQAERRPDLPQLLDEARRAVRVIDPDGARHEEMQRALTSCQSR